MQNQNVHPWSWGQGSAPPFAGAQPMLPTSFPPPGMDQNPLLSGYQQMYGSAPGQPPPDYGQWTAAQLQQWQQWQQWQEKYQQWQAQYGKKYAESLAALGQNSSLVIPGVPPGIIGMPKPVESSPSNAPSAGNPPLPVNSQPVVPPPPPDEEKPPLPFSAAAMSAIESSDPSKNGCPPVQDDPEELSEAEKTFDVQFKQWEGQFNEWKKQNQDHPDKAQYREYEKKWETWREQLLQRREQMRRKRLSKSTDQPNEGSSSSNNNSNSTGKIDDSKSKPTTPSTASAPAKPLDSEYTYRTQAGPVPLASFPVEPPKFENKVPFFEKPPDGQLAPSPLASFNQILNSNQEKNSIQPVYPANHFPGYGLDKGDSNRGPTGGFAVVNQIFNRNLGPFGNQAGSFESGQDKGCTPSAGARFPGNLENFPPRQRFGNEDRNMGAIQRFPERENFRNEREFGQRFFESGREVRGEMGSQNFGTGDVSGRMGNEVGIDFRPGNCPPGMKHVQNHPVPKPKVPSLFDITVEKPPGLPPPGSLGDRKPGKPMWENHEKDHFFGDSFEKRQQEEREQSAWGKSTSTPSPWIQPWELEKLMSQKPSEARPWEKDVAGKQEIDKAELSGYVGSILAKLGSFNVVPANLTKNENSQEENAHGDRSHPSQLDPGNRTNRNRGMGPKGKEEEANPSQNNAPPHQIGDGRFRGAPLGSFGGPSASRDFDQRGNDRLVGNSGYPPTNFDHLDESKKDADERNRFDQERRNYDVDERMTVRENRGPFRRDDRGPMFGREEPRNFNRPPPTSRDDHRQNFHGEERFFGRDERSSGRSGRGERGFGRFNSRDDVDERFGNRNGRRGFDRFHRDEREGRFFDRPGGPFDRFGRNRDHQQLNEPVWNPQVFDYSQGRPQKLADPEDGFKISTVVDYSHGENKQTFDYGHGEVAKDRLEMKSFDYGHKTEAPTVIDYGHGVDRDLLSKDCRRDRPQDGEKDVDDRLKSNSGIASPIRRRSRSPRGRLRSHSRSPHSRFKRGSNSPPFRGRRSKSRDRLGKQLFKRDRNGSEDSEVSKQSFDVTTVLVEDLICLPGRETRPNKLVFIMRGIPGSGKTYVTKLIKDKEVELGGDAPRILSLDDYFMTEVEKEIIDKETGRKIKTKVLEYEYEAGVEPHYRGSLLKAFKKTVSDGFFSFIIVDSVNEKTEDYEEMWSFAKQKGFQAYIAEMDNDVTVCKGRNIHKRTEKEISDLVKAWEETPAHYLRLDVRSLLQSDAITEVEMEVVSDTELEKSADKGGGETREEAKSGSREEGEGVDAGVDAAGGEGDGDGKEKKEDEDEDEPGVSAFVKSRWDQFENSEQNLDRLDGLKRRREGFHATMEEYLQLPEELDPQINSDSAPGKKRVRWADLEERRQQEKMRAIGFIVGQTDWNRMTDPTFGEKVLTRTKFI